MYVSHKKETVACKISVIMIEGHGGMMDRMDSLCFAAPIFHVIRYFYV